MSYLGKGEEMKLTYDLSCELCKDSIDALSEKFREYKNSKTPKNLMVEVVMKEDLNAHGVHTHDHIIAVQK